MAELPIAYLAKVEVHSFPFVFSQCAVISLYEYRWWAEPEIEHCCASKYFNARRLKCPLAWHNAVFWIAETCDNVDCGPGKRCKMNRRSKPRCVCAPDCSNITWKGPVCGTDGKTYKDECALLKAKCKGHPDLDVQYQGKCKSKKSSRCGPSDITLHSPTVNTLTLVFQFTATSYCFHPFQRRAAMSCVLAVPRASWTKQTTRTAWRVIGFAQKWRLPSSTCAVMTGSSTPAPATWEELPVSSAAPLEWRTRGSALVSRPLGRVIGQVIVSVLISFAVVQRSCFCQHSSEELVWACVCLVVAGVFSKNDRHLIVSWCWQNDTLWENGKEKGEWVQQRSARGCGAVFHFNIFESDGLPNRMQSVSRCYLCHCFQLQPTICNILNQVLFSAIWHTLKSTIIHQTKDFIRHLLPLNLQRPSRARTSSAALGKSACGTLGWAEAAARCATKPAWRAGQMRRCAPAITPHIPANVPWNRPLALWEFCWRSSTRALATVSRQQT